MNQALFMHPTKFEPMNKAARFKDVGTGMPYIYYEDEEPAIKLEENGDVTFSMRAPGATTVEVCGFGGTLGNEKIALEKCEDGVFRKTVSGIRQGFLYHRWFVDGVQTMNPMAPFAYGCFGATNFFEKPKKENDFWYIKDVPHGDVQIHTYVSKVNKHLKQCYVYTPPCYKKEENRKYPVLYILHGVGEAETGWIWNGKLNFIMDNLIANQQCEDMIVVSLCGYAFQEGEKAVFFPGDFGTELVESAIPYIESKFQVKKGRDNRALAGLSLGSAQAIQIVSRFQHLFAHLGVFSGVRYDETELIIKQNEVYPMKTVLMTAGTDETGLAQLQIPFTDRFLELGAAGGQRSYEGHHEWHVWRESARDFATMIFKDNCLEDEKEPVFTYEEPKLSSEQLDAQTFRAHVCMFDPIYKSVIFDVDENGRPAGRYVDDHPGVEILDVKKGIARFMYRAGDAKTVEANVWGMPKASMTRQEGSDWWSVEVSGIEKGFHYYSILVNGVDIVDSNAPVGYGGFRTINFLEMPEEDFEEYRIRQVPHGAVHLNYYQSKETGLTKLCYVYTPASYDECPDKRYPVLYLQHGGGENETGWIWQGKLNNIADNLIAKGQMKEMIIVMNTGYAFPESGEWHHSLTAFIDELPSSCVPFIDQTYRTIADKDSRAMAGLSMGGFQTQKVTFAHPELFAWAGLFSSILSIKDEDGDYSDILLNPEEFGKRFKLLFVSCGLQEGFYEGLKATEEQIKAAGVPLETFHAYGYHDWTFWRHCLNEFLRKLF